jgi:hypothetical protein
MDERVVTEAHLAAKIVQGFPELGQAPKALGAVDEPLCQVKARHAGRSRVLNVVGVRAEGRRQYDL